MRCSPGGRPSTMGLLTLQRRCCCLSPGGPARRWRGSGRRRKTHLSLCRSCPRTSLSSSDPFGIFNHLVHRTRAATLGHRSSCPRTGASNAVLGGAGGHWAVGLCQPQSKRRPNPTPSPSGRVKPFRGHHTTPYHGPATPTPVPRAASEVAEDREPVEAARFAVTLRVFAVLPLSQRGRPQNAMQAARSSRSPLGLSFSTRPLRLSQATPYAAPFFVVPRIPICMVRLCVLLSH